ncbi:MAG: aggregation factor core [Pseudomonadota bacterium]
MNAIRRATAAATLVLSSLAVSAASAASIEASFIEGAPKDRFVIRNSGPCPLAASRITIDLNGSRGALIFDTTGAGAGVEVFQPLEIVEGRAQLTSVPKVRDGDRSIALDVRVLSPREAVAFTIDVDDTLTNSALGQIRVADSEIEGAVLRVETAGDTRTATFDQSSAARIDLPGCTS